MIEPRVTAIMPIRNARKTLWDSLRSLANGVGTMPVRVLLCDNGSDDGTEDAVANPKTLVWLRSLELYDVRVLESVPSKEGVFPGADPEFVRNKNLEHMLAKFAWEIEHTEPVTPFVFRLDADVKMPSKGLMDLVMAMTADPGLGLLGIKYPPVSDHVGGGCTLYRWEPLRQIAEAGFSHDGCDCRWLHKEMERRGWAARHIDGMEAEHMKGR